MRLKHLIHEFDVKDTKTTLLDTILVAEGEYGKNKPENEDIEAGSESIKPQIDNASWIAAECKPDINHYSYKVTIENQGSNMAYEWEQKGVSDKAKHRWKNLHCGGEEDEIIGIITLEDVFEELIQVSDFR